MFLMELTVLRLVLTLSLTWCGILLMIRTALLSATNLLIGFHQVLQLIKRASLSVLISFLNSLMRTFFVSNIVPSKSSLRSKSVLVSAPVFLNN